MKVMTQMMPTCQSSPSWPTLEMLESMWDMPALICFTPSPSDVQTPKVVQAMESASIASPTGP
eukprot:1195065-Rhodomonas_salina.1